MSLRQKQCHHNSCWSMKCLCSTLILSRSPMPRHIGIHVCHYSLCKWLSSHKHVWRWDVLFLLWKREEAKRAPARDVSIFSVGDFFLMDDSSSSWVCVFVSFAWIHIFCVLTTDYERKRHAKQNTQTKKWKTKKKKKQKQRWKETATTTKRNKTKNAWNTE